jgi:glycosyltransferase involved in cell wall biosynthesis
MPTSGRRRFIPTALRLFFAQDYPNKELVILDDGRESVGDLMPNHPSVRYVRVPSGASLGAKRNTCCEIASGEVLMHWDDDDWYSPGRITKQVQILRQGFQICGITRPLFVQASTDAAWKYTVRNDARIWICGATLAFYKTFWVKHRFPEVNLGEDALFTSYARISEVGVVDDTSLFVGRIHAKNTSPKRTGGHRWQPVPLEQIRATIGHGWADFVSAEQNPDFVDQRRALLVASGGIGDILRATPLIRAAFYLGHEVDVLLTPDQPDAADLLRCAPEIRTLRVRQASSRSVFDDDYETVLFTPLSRRLNRFICPNVSRRLGLHPSSRGENESIAALARLLGWEGELPLPFAMTSTRDFGLVAGTLALHPGCKANWPWKRWHGFADLARMFDNIVIIGTEADRDNSRTYFKTTFEWPAKAKDFTGLSLLDTAALIQQCDALVAPDSGMMHLAAALGVKTFGIFGITSPKRECMSLPWMIPITRALPCEANCHSKAREMSNCARQIECLRTLTAENVRERMTFDSDFMQPRERENQGLLSVNYYGEVSTPNGYGEAARAYVHALHSAGVKVCVIDTGNGANGTHDDLISALLGYDETSVFDIVHGLPTSALLVHVSSRRLIAMTVWEADQIPRNWVKPLRGALDVWVPTEENKSNFAKDLGPHVFCLPHALSASLDEPISPIVIEGLRDDDFVFYSIFEWQHRKNPVGLITAFLRAFADDTDAVLVIKIGPSSAPDATEALQIVREATKSSARILLCYEPLTASQIRYLHRRGSCYISLHRGEGWGYPIFDAATLGTPVIATDYGGPSAYLDARSHWLVRYKVAAVTDEYFLFRGHMRWAEPDLVHAIQGLRWVYEHRALAKERAVSYSPILRERYSNETVGTTARERLLHLKSSLTSPLLGGRSPTKFLRSPVQRNAPHADYCHQVATMLHKCLPEVRSYIEAGCGNGELVWALRRQGLSAQGFDKNGSALLGADPQVKGYLRRGSAESIALPERSVDTMIAHRFVQTLSDAQIESFLVRSRTWVRRSLILLLSVTQQSEQSTSETSTLRSDVWWDDRFAGCGWESDPRQNALRNQPFISAMRIRPFLLRPRL